MHEGPSTSAAIPSEEWKLSWKILASPIFRRAPGHSRFLEFVVHKTLEGAANLVKEYSIGVEVFGRRSNDYDTGLDPGVRVEAGRLRSRLAEYYKDMCQHDPIHIDLPKGTYVPIFYRNGVEPTLEQSVSETAWGAGSHRRHDEVVRPREGRWYARPTASIVSVAAIVAIGIMAFILIRMLAMDNRPQSGRLEGSTLVVSNTEGKELWRRSFSDGFWADYYEQGVAPRLRFGDLNGDGHLEVLFAYHPGVNPNSTSATLICYSDRGKEEWRWMPGRQLPELAGSPATFDIRDFAVLKQSGKTLPRIVVSSSHMPEYPDQVAIVDSHGKTVSDYWHSGHLAHLTLADLDGDGREEIIATGISNGYHAATLIALDPDRLLGASTEAARPEIQIHGMGVAAERIRLLFHRSDLNVAMEPYNQDREITVEQGKLD